MIKKLLALVLSLMLAFGFAGCSSDKENDEKHEDTKVEEKADKEEEKEEKEDKVEKKEKKEVSDEDAATETAEAFLDAFVDFDYEGLQDVVTDPDEVPEEFKMLNAEALMEQIGGMPEEFGGYEEEFAELFEIMIDNMKSECSYEIKDVEEDGGDYVFTGVLTMPDFDSMNFDAYFEEAFSDEAMETLLTEMLENGDITEDMSEEDMMDAIMTAVIDAAKDAVEGIDFGAEVTEEEFELVVVKDSSDWLVDTSKGYFGE